MSTCIDLPTLLSDPLSASGPAGDARSAQPRRNLVGMAEVGTAQVGTAHVGMAAAAPGGRVLARGDLRDFVLEACADLPSARCASA